MRAKKSDYPEMFLGGFMKKRKEGKGFFGNSQAKFADMAGAEGGIDMRFKGGGPFAGKGSALRREKRALKRAQRRGQLGEDGADRLDYLRSVQKDRAKKAVGAGALAAGAAFGGAALAGKLGAKGAGGLFKGGMKGVFKGGAKGGGKQGLFNFGAKEGGKRSFMDRFARNLAKRRLQNMGEATDSMEGNYDTTVTGSYGEDGMKVAKYRKGGLVGDQHELDKNKDGRISGEDFKMMGKGGMVYADGGDKIPTYLSRDPEEKEIAFLDPQTESDLTVSRISPHAGHSRELVLNPQGEAGIQRLVDLGLASKAFRDDSDFTRDFTLDEGTTEEQRKEYLSAQHAIMRDSPVAKIVREGGRPGILDGEYVDSNDPANRAAIRAAIDSGDKNAKFEVNIEQEFEKMVAADKNLKRMFEDYFTEKGGFTDQERGFARMNNLNISPYQERQGATGESNTDLFRRLLTGVASGGKNSLIAEDQARRMGGGFRDTVARNAEDRLHSFGMYVQDKFDKEAAKRAQKYRTSINY